MRCRCAEHRINPAGEDLNTELLSADSCAFVEAHPLHDRAVDDGYGPSHESAEELFLRAVHIHIARHHEPSGDEGPHAGAREVDVDIVGQILAQARVLHNIKHAAIKNCGEVQQRAAWRKEAVALKFNTFC